MLEQLELLNGHLKSIDGRLELIARAAAAILESGSPEPKLFMADVLDYLRISERTYYRKLSEGKLVPRKWEGPDYFFPSDLEAEYAESRRRGRI